MIYTQDQKKKIWENVDKIKAFIQTLQPQVLDRIAIDFGEMQTYRMFEREHECHLYVYRDSISGRIGGLPIAFEREESKSVSSNVYDYIDYTVKLIQNWSFIKGQLQAEIEKQHAAISAINNFEV